MSKKDETVYIAKLDVLSDNTCSREFVCASMGRALGVIYDLILGDASRSTGGVNDLSETETLIKFIDDGYYYYAQESDHVYRVDIKTILK